VALYESVKSGVRVTAEPGLSGTAASVDADGIRRVLINLLDNALEATPEGGSVTVRSASADGLLRIVVEDTGRGIPPGDRERIFQPYFSTKGRGTGLGLALSRRIVTDHGGTIRAEERAGGGTRFVVELPA
jgi:signal transduction histidine kinase